jgi:hypothetical protein
LLSVTQTCLTVNPTPSHAISEPRLLRCTAIVGGVSWFGSLPTHLEVQGRTVTMPVMIRDSTVAAAVFCCSAAAARTAVTDDRLTPFTVAGRGIAVLNEFLLTARTRRGRSPYPDFGHQLVICWGGAAGRARAGELLYSSPQIRLEGLRVRLGGAWLVLGQHRMAQTTRSPGYVLSAAVHGRGSNDRQAGRVHGQQFFNV